VFCAFRRKLVWMRIGVRQMKHPRSRAARPWLVSLGVALALASSACTTNSAGGSSSVAKNVSTAEHEGQHVSARVSGTPAEVTRVKALLRGMGPLTVDAVAVGTGKPFATNFALRPGQVWLTVRYPYDGPQADVAATFEAQVLAAGYAKSCHGAGIPCVAGYSVISGPGTKRHVLAARFTSAGAGAETTVGSLVSAVRAAAAETPWTDVRVQGITFDGGGVVVTATARSAADFESGLDPISRSIASRHPMLLEVRDAKTGSPMAAISRTLNAGSSWIAPAWKTQP